MCKHGGTEQGRSQDLNFRGAIHALVGAVQRVDPDKAWGGSGNLKEFNHMGGQFLRPKKLYTGKDILNSIVQIMTGKDITIC